MEPDDNGGLDSGRFVAWLAGLAVAGLVLRIAWIIAERHVHPVTDGQFYFGLAHGLAHGRGFLNPYEYARTGRIVASANHTPAWPLLLTVPHVLGFGSFLSSQVFAAFVGTATVVAMGFAGRAMMGTRVGLLAAGIAAVYPNVWVYERELMSETLALLLVAITMFAAYRYRSHADVRSSALLGGLCGLLALTHPNYLLLVPLLCAPLILWMRDVQPRRRLWLLAVAVAAASVVVAPWVAYNASRFKEPVVMTTAFGLTLVDANCPSTYYGPNLGSWEVLCSLPQPRTNDASKADNQLRRRAQRYVANHLARLPIVLLAREGRTWGFFRPLQQNHLDSHIGSELWVERLRLFVYWMLAPLAVIGGVIVHRRGVTLIPVGALFLLVVVTVALSFGDTRYRAPAEVPIVLLASTALDNWPFRLQPAHHRRAASVP